MFNFLPPTNPPAALLIGGKEANCEEWKATYSWRTAADRNRDITEKKFDPQIVGRSIKIITENIIPGKVHKAVGDGLIMGGRLLTGPQRAAMLNNMND